MPTLTQAQSDFINSKAAYIRLLAPAGCGKTFSIIEKTRDLFINNPRLRIAIFTFTRGAADEIRERCGDDVVVSVNTLNSWGNNYVKNSVLKNAKLITNPADRKFCILNNLQCIWHRDEHAEIFEKLFTGRSKVKHSEEILEMMDLFKNIGFIHTDFNKSFEHDKNVYYKHLEFINKVGLKRYYETVVDSLVRKLDGALKNSHNKTTKRWFSFLSKKTNDDSTKVHDAIIKYWIPFWRDCCEHMQNSGLYTMDDQKYFANIELLKRVAKHEKWTGASKLDYIFIDEFQDTSPLDLMLVSNLQKLTDAALVIVGDDDQAIYEFRGATPYFILHPDEIFGQQFTTFVLDENFRSPANIVDKSMDLIANNVHRYAKRVKPVARVDQADIALHTYDSSEKMISAVIDDIKHTLETTDENYTIAVLSRLKAHLLPYQVLLTKDNISYTVSEDLAFFLTGAAEHLNRVMEIKKKNNIVNRDDLIELVCLNSKHEIHKGARSTLNRLFLANNAKISNIRDILSAIGAKVSVFQNLFTDEFIAKFMDATTRFLEATNVYETLDSLLNYFDGLKQNYSRSLEDLYYRDPPLASLLDFATNYGNDYESFLDDFNAAIEKATISKESQDLILFDEHPRVVLSTALRVKGQQYDKVIVLNVDDGIWPKSQARAFPEAYETERRLFYVAVTRSKQSLTFYRTESHHGQNTTISPFMYEGHYVEGEPTQEDQ